MRQLQYCTGLITHVEKMFSSAMFVAMPRRNQWRDRLYEQL